MSSWADEEQARVNTQIALLLTLRLLLLTHVNLMLVINEIDNRCPGVAVVDIVTEPGSVDNSEFDLERLFLKFGLDDLDLGCLYV